MHPQGVRHVQEMAEFHLGAALHALDRRPVQAGGVGEGFLGHVEVQPSYTDAVSRGPAGFENPLGLVGWHQTNLLATMIISQQQICGIF